MDVTPKLPRQVFPSNREAGSNRIGAVYRAASFGSVDIDWWERAVTLSLRYEAGEPA